MNDLPWHGKAGASAVEALRNWCDVLLAEKAQASQALVAANKVQAASTSERENLSSHRTAVEGAAVENETLKKKLSALEAGLQQREVAYAAAQANLEKREADLKKDAAAFRSECAATAQALTSREQQVAKDRKQLDADRAAHDKRVAKVREAVG